MTQGSLSRLLKNVARRLLGRPSPPVVAATHRFDAEHGTDTSGLLYPAQLSGTPLNRAHVTAYFGVPPSRFQAAIARWQATPGTRLAAEVRLIDIGCGKGRAVLLASQMGFRDVIGLELYPELAAIAERNLAAWQQTHATSPATILCADAVTALPGLLSGATLLYLYNPFRAPVLRDLLRVIQSQADRAEPLDVLYLYPEHEAVFTEFPAFQQLWRKEIPLDTSDEGDGLSSATDPCSLYRLLPR